MSQLNKNEFSRAIPTFMTIREMASTGILSEGCLRKMYAQHKLPGIHTGRTFRINVDQFIDQLNRDSAENSKA